MLDASREIDQLIARTADWRGATLAKLRAIIRAADPEIIEEWKWMGSPVWSCAGIIAVANPHKGKVKLTFDHGARLSQTLFNAGLEGNQRRAIDFFETDEPDAPALTALVQEAIAFNRAKKRKS